MPPLSKRKLHDATIGQSRRDACTDPLILGGSIESRVCGIPIFDARPIGNLGSTQKPRDFSPCRPIERHVPKAVENGVSTSSSRGRLRIEKQGILRTNQDSAAVNFFSKSRVYIK